MLSQAIFVKFHIVKFSYRPPTHDISILTPDSSSDSGKPIQASFRVEIHTGSILGNKSAIKPINICENLRNNILD